jgi:hypothetical protein
MPPFPMNIAEKWLKERLESEFPGRKLINARLSNITEDKPEQNRTRCQKRAQCDRGCSFGAYFSTRAVTLPAARATGRLTLRSDNWVTNLEYDPAQKRVTGVRMVDANTGQVEVVQARMVFLCASAMNSLHILLNSRPAGSERSYFHSNGALGSAVMDHIFRVGVSGDIPGMSEFVEYGRRPGGVYVPRFRSLEAEDHRRPTTASCHGWRDHALGAHRSMVFSPRSVASFSSIAHCRAAAMEKVGMGLTVWQ